ncbi:MAG: pyridoxal 5'-phosphate synthase glutaminase subunit PdxT [Desulfobacterales bacterium]|nr:pyridoxal 5'-phosphate synthase glutaminase subunit PdxT [Desulfobacterales bacterium]
MKIGVLSLQGDFIEHAQMLSELGVDPVAVRLPEDLRELEGLIIPGGESTTIGKLLIAFHLLEPLRKFAIQKPVWGTCAGMILLAKDVGTDQPLLSLMDIKVQRNAFGRQADSFEAYLHVPVLKNGETQPFPAVFIRAPRLISVKNDAVVIAELADGTAVAAQQGKWLATAFHPELTRDTRFHQYFLKLINV